MILSSLETGEAFFLFKSPSKIDALFGSVAFDGDDDDESSDPVVLLMPVE